jgi:hypothetical protein
MTHKGQNMLRFYYNQLLKCTVVMLSKLKWDKIYNKMETSVRFAICQLYISSVIQLKSHYNL